MKKYVFLLMFFILASSFSVYAEDNLQTEFKGFEAIELSLEEAAKVNGGETYVGYTYVAFGCWHTFTLITDKPITDSDFKVIEIYESGAENSKTESFFSSLGFGNNVRQHYNSAEDIKADPNSYYLALVGVPNGMSIKDYDNKIIKVAESYFKEKPRKYSIWKNSCNTTTSTIIKRSGGFFKPGKRVPGWKY